MTDQGQPLPSYTPASSDAAALKQAGASPLRSRDPGQIGPYIPVGLLGTGGMGRVYLARPTDNTPGLAAVKVIRPEYADDPRFRRRFEREASLHGRVSSARAPQLLGTGFDDSLLWMATQYLPGLNLADAVRECGPLEVAGVWRLVSDLGQALSEMAVAGIVHRDLKPSNVVLTQQGAHVIDFGIAQATDSSAITATGSRVGTPAFMAPEHLREGRCDTASDVFSLAGSLIYAATGHAPFGDGTGVDVMHRVAFEEPKPSIMAWLTARDAGLAALLSACLSKDPAGRPTPRQLTEAAEAAGGHRSPCWQEPLGGRLLARRQACDVLEGSVVQEVVQETGRLRTPAQGSATPATGPVRGPARGSGAGRGKRKVYLAVAAGLAACAVVAGTFFLTRPSVGGTASAAPTVAGGTARDGARTSPVPGSSASPSGARVDENTKAEGGKKKEATSGTPADEASPDPRTTGGEATPTAAPESGEGGGSADAGDTPPTASPSKTATTPEAPPWNSRCTYYSGTELTVRGDKGQRVVQVQCMLTQRGFEVGDGGVDGQFGRATRAAVKKFQRAKGLSADGKVGPDTWAALRSST
ncbi:protein kinase domain-containing protein [Streptomyces cahuitamycinicus]|uniref:Serine/threonine protein kinase n=1 Tax=Streptomyces cahuitamycinicus TaxID=2070367 RepID=A0A2N8TLS3_9ACTN|nr:protein kinase [Streptomyces cahuitamycinicus]PNG19923.1 serine/threonine protein kinase [Streptomyces cahuitamycinicus]